MRLGLVRTSLKENERRLPIYPEHFPRLPLQVRQHTVLEASYGAAFGYNDSYFTGLGATCTPREEIFSLCDLVILPKPVPDDLAMMHPGQVLCGWMHCVQQTAFAQEAIRRRLTLIAWEDMHLWGAGGERQMHIFYKNNELAGYAAILQVLQLLGIDGFYGPRRRVVALGYGSVTRGAIFALHGRGFNNIQVFSRRPSHLISHQHPDVYFSQYIVPSQGPVLACHADGATTLLIDELADADMICNGVLQDTRAPVIFVNEQDLCRLKPRSVIVDISCDARMGFFFARPTTFEQPTFIVGNEVTYYSVDHTPSYLWNAASREISRAFLPFLQCLLGGPCAWESNTTITRAIAIKDGTVLDPRILAFQKRHADYPHEIIRSSSHGN